MKRHIYTLKKLSAFVALLMLAVSADAQTYAVAQHNSGSCGGSLNIDDVFTTGGIFNISKMSSGCGATNGYTYYPSPATQGLWIRQGGSATVYVTNGHPATAQNCKVWVDFNDDGTFANTEQVFYGAVAGGNTASGTFTVPSNATISTTRMRVRLSSSLGAGSDATVYLTGGESEDYDVEILSSTVPECDTVTNIQASSISLTGATLTWDPPAGGGMTRYETHISTSPTPPTGSGFNPVTTESITVNNLQPSTCYYLHVRTNCNPALTTTAESDWTSYQFCTVQDCDRPNVVIDRITGTTAVATWDPVPTVYSYEYAVSTTPAPPVAGTHTTSTAVQLLGLAPNRTLYFHIRSKCNPTPQSLWKTVPFHTTVGTSVEDVNNNAILDIYPNPVQNQLNIRLNDKIADIATVTLTDVTGKIMYNNTITGDAQIDMSSLPKGVYMLKYADGKRYQVAKIMKD